MKRGKLITMAAVLLSAAQLTSPGGEATAQTVQEQPTVTFRAGVDLVRVSAVVRDRKGRFVQDLKVRDFEILESGKPKAITDFRHDKTGVSVAVLFDVSGSMEGLMAKARDAASHLLGWLNAEDEAAIFTFDTHLDEIAPFTVGLRAVPMHVESVTPFGATSLHDAIARTAERVGARDGRRRAVVVFTDGLDTYSRLTPAQVSGIASAIDVPVYIVGIVSSIDDPTADVGALGAGESALSGSLGDLAAWTGGHTFIASVPAQRSIVARQIVDELRHQYLIAFESSARPGWHPLVVRARSKDLVVRARSGYIAGHSRPTS
jgi:Ca-activated chloride channel family protein